MLMVYMDQDEFVAMYPGEGAGTEPMPWDREMEARGVRRSGGLLRPASDATTVRVRGEETLLSDGPRRAPPPTGEGFGSRLRARSSCPARQATRRKAPS